MKRLLTVSALVLGALTLTESHALNVSIYSSGYTEEGNGPGLGVATTANSGLNLDSAVLAGTFTSPDIQFGTTFSDNWHPFGLADFAAVIEGSVNAAGGSYLISLLSDDGSYMYIDGVLQISRPGPHGPDFTSETIALTPGFHTVRVEFYECCGGASALDAQLPTGVIFQEPPPTNGVPDGGASFGLLAAASAGLAVARKFRK